MKAVFQRVLSASVRVAEGRVTGSIGPGALVLLGVEREDTLEEADLLADKIAGLRVFADEDGRMNRSVLAGRWWYPISPCAAAAATAAVRNSWPPRARRRRCHCMSG